MAVIRSEDGLRINVFPITDGEIWDDPCERFVVDEDEIQHWRRRSAMTDIAAVPGLLVPPGSR